MILMSLPALSFYIAADLLEIGQIQRIAHQPEHILRRCACPKDQRVEQIERDDVITAQKMRQLCGIAADQRFALRIAQRGRARRRRRGGLLLFPGWRCAQQRAVLTADTIMPVQRGQQLPVLQAVLLMLIQMRHDIAFIFIAHAFVAAHQRIIDLLFHSHAHYLLTAAAHPSAAAHVPSPADSARV